MAYTHEIRPTQGTGPLEYAFILVLVAAFAVLAVFAIGRLTSLPMTKAGSCLTSSVCSIDGASSSPAAVNAPAHHGD